MLPVVALVGRPNVGKSTLFNAMTRSRDALVADMPGVTRDRHYGVCHLGPRPFVVVDTGGLSGVEEGLDALTAQQVRLAIDEAQVLVFVVDARDGLLPQDQGILGPPDAYPILKVGGDGKAEAEAKLEMPEPAQGQYFINVHASPANMGTIVACGNLAPPSQ